MQNTSTDERVAEMRLELHDFMMGFAQGDAERMATLHRSNWALAAQIEQLRRHPLVAALGDELLAAIATRAIDPSAEARYLAARLREVDAEAAQEAADAAALASQADPDLPPQYRDQMLATITLIAKDALRIPTLETRNSDSLDFHTCSVWGIREALIDAYEEGFHIAP